MIDESQAGDIGQTVTDLEALWALPVFEGTPEQFWPACLQVMSRIAGASDVHLALRPADDQRWRVVSTWPALNREDPSQQLLATTTTQLAVEADRSGRTCQQVKLQKNAAAFVVCVALRSGSTKERCVAGALIKGATEAVAVEAAGRLQLVANLPQLYQLGRASEQARQDVSRIATALDLLLLLNAEERFVAAAMVVCNELTNRLALARVSLGWQRRRYVRLAAISRTEKFEAKASVVSKLEGVMEEALEQDEEVVWPASDAARYVYRDHEGFARSQGLDGICSLPLRIDGEAVAVITCERNDEGFSDGDLALLRLCCDQVVRRLDDLQRTDRWFGARLVGWIGKKLHGLLSTEHTWAKLIALLVAITLAVLIFVKVPYRVEAPFVVRSHDVIYVPAPFDGYIGEVGVNVGDVVTENAVLLTFDTRELTFQETALLADRTRYRREMEKARAEQALAEMRIAQAQLEQAEATLALTRFRLQQAEIRAPFTGYVVEGDLSERIGAPVKQGEILFRVAKLDDLFVELSVDERDVHELPPLGEGQIAFASQPELKFPIAVERLEPVAEARQDGNVFVVNAVFTDGAEEWFRPGMTGIGKLHVGPRRLVWIFSHRTVDFLRLFFWW